MDPDVLKRRTDEYLATRGGEAFEVLGIAGGGELAARRRDLLGSMLREFACTIVIEEMKDVFGVPA